MIKMIAKFIIKEKKMVEYIFENKRLNATIPVVIFCSQNPKTVNLLQFLSEDEASVVVRQVKKLTPKNGQILSLDTAKHKIIIAISDVKNEKNLQLLGGKIYQHIKKEANAVICLIK